jgi:hypothetical protein
MLVAARSVPNEWGAHVTYAGTPPGLGIHALNLDADVGPWLQVLKLKALKDEAAAAGRESLAGSEIELMNLAGPRTGLEMMTPVARYADRRSCFSGAATTETPSCGRPRPSCSPRNDRMEAHINRARSRFAKSSTRWRR